MQGNRSKVAESNPCWRQKTSPNLNRKKKEIEKRKRKEKKGGTMLFFFFSKRRRKDIETS